MDWIYNNYDLAITIACIAAVIVTVLILAIVMPAFRSAREVVDEVDEEEGGVQ